MGVPEKCQVEIRSRNSAMQGAVSLAANRAVDGYLVANAERWTGLCTFRGFLDSRKAAP